MTTVGKRGAKVEETVGVAQPYGAFLGTSEGGHAHVKPKRERDGRRHDPHINTQFDVVSSRHVAGRGKRGGQAGGQWQGRSDRST